MYAPSAIPLFDRVFAIVVRLCLRNKQATAQPAHRPVGRHHSCNTTPGQSSIPPGGNAFEPLSLGLFAEFGAVCGIVAVGDPVIEGFASNSLPQARIPVFLGPFVELCMIRGPALEGAT